MSDERKKVLSIAGFDPSGGAGLLADSKTFEMHQVQGMGVCTALTFQNETKFEGLVWVPWSDIEKQLEVLFQTYTFEHVKIGLVEGLEVLEKIVDYLRVRNPNVMIIWDPIMKASVGYDFHKKLEPETLFRILKKIYVVLPNIPEMNWLNPDGVAPSVSARKLSKYCAVLLKGGHSKGNTADDMLFENDQQYVFKQNWVEGGEKHGSGCVLSSSLTANLAKGYNLVESCRKSKNYTTNFSFQQHRITGISFKPMNINKLHYISQEMDNKTHADLIEEACRAGVKWVQLRMKNKSYEEALSIAQSVKEICRRHDATMIINDHVAIAKEIGADGVHLGKSDMNPVKAREILGNDFIIGGTANTMKDIQQLQSAGVNYIGLGPFRFTSTKENLSPVLGLKGYYQLLEKGKTGSGIPIIAIGGITAEDVEAILDTGVHGVAIGSLINMASDKKAIVERLNRKIIDFTNFSF